MSETSTCTPTARGSWVHQPPLTAEWVGGQHGYLWLGIARDDAGGVPSFVTAMSKAQARQLRDFLDAHVGGPT